VGAADASVLALKNSNSGARRFIQREIERATGARPSVPVLDGTACAVRLAESLVRLDLKTSKRNTYAAPLAKPYAGELKRLSPG
jgi:Asp/Glu/hydantoin racemase